MMVANKCDRCGKLFEERPGYMKTPRVSPGMKPCYDIPLVTIKGVANSSRSEYYIRSKELCYECYEEFLKWFDGGQNDG